MIREIANPKCIANPPQSLVTIIIMQQPIRRPGDDALPVAGVPPEPRAAATATGDKDVRCDRRDSASVLVGVGARRLGLIPSDGGGS